VLATRDRKELVWNVLGFICIEALNLSHNKQ
jgi:hypothetical protein